MGERTEYTPGTFCSVDLAAADTEAAKAFYAELFGWDAGDVYREWIPFSLDGKLVAGLLEQPDAQRGAGIPSNWVSYVSVTDADSTVARAVELGGTVVAPPADIGEGGRMGVLADPQGAVFALWQPIGHAGAQLVNVPGALTWNQLNTSDTEAAIAFYTELFGWTTEAAEGGAPYWTFRNSENWMNGGVMALPPEMAAPPHWLPYFASGDLEAQLTRVPELGGKALTPILPLPAGNVFVAQDSQGAIFGLFEGELEP